MRRAGVAHSGQGARVCVDCTRRVICAVVSSISQASRRSTVASGNKRAKMGCSGVETKAGSFCQGCGLWGHGASVGPTVSGWSRRGYEDIYGRSTPDAKVFQSVISPKGAKNHNPVLKGWIDADNLVPNFR